MRGRRGSRYRRGKTVRGKLHDESKQDESGSQDDDLIAEQLQALQRQDDFPKLTEEELEAKIERVLLPQNPQAASNYADFSYKHREFKTTEQIDQMVVHFSMDGKYLYQDSNEAREQEEFIESKKTEAKILIETYSVEEALPMDMDERTMLKSLRNQFNYAERTAQTFTNPVKERGVSTEPPPRQSFSGTVTQWEIYDTYMTEIFSHQAQSKQADKEEKQQVRSKRRRRQEQKEDPIFSSEMRYALKVMERMVYQNEQPFFYTAFKYIDNTSDLTRTYEGSLTPLWSFVSEKTKKKEVTALSWNPRYYDLFAVGYGSYNFMKRMTGLICCYSLKNPRYPEFFFTTQEGVMCLDWHPQHPALLAVGLYDGTVLVFDVRSKHKKPIYQSNVRTNKHTDPVWQVIWQEEDTAKNLNFFSISTDGRVTNWVLMKNKLEPEEIIRLKLVSNQPDGDEDETALSGLAGGTCFDFNPYQRHLFIVGTEEGKIHKCNKAYSGQYLETFDGHFMAVYAVKWNRFHPKIFLSCSADWTVKMWDHTVKSPLIRFDLGFPVGDVAWAPYSSTIFSAITSDHKCHVYNLQIDKHSDVCDKKVLGGKLNKISFNPTQPIIIIGNDKGMVQCFKLSPNLQKGMEEPTDEEKEAGMTAHSKEVKRMEDLLGSIDRNVY